MMSKEITAKVLPFKIFGQEIIGVFEGDTLLAFTNPQFQNRIVRALKTDVAVMGAFAGFQEPATDKIKFNEFIIDSSWIVKVGFANGYDIVDNQTQRISLGKGLLKVTKVQNIKGISTQVPMVYRRVPEETFIYLRNASSAGAAYNNQVRNEYERVDYIER